MKRMIWMVGVIVLVAGAAGAQGTVLFSDNFDTGTLGPKWRVVEGEWQIAEGALTNIGGGLIVLDHLPGNRFVWEAEINFPGNWMSLIMFYETPGDYGTLYFGGGYWEYFEMEHGGIGGYIQHRDSEITTGVDHQIKVVADYGRLTLYYDGKLKGQADLRPRAGSRLAFRNLERGGRVRIKSVRLSTLEAGEPKVVRALQPADLAQSTVFSETGLEAKPGKVEKLTGDLTRGLELKYNFEPGPTFSSRCARVPLTADRGKYVLCDVESDGSGNKVFLIVHDRSGEQHLVGEFTLSWKGWQECAANLSAFLESPSHKQRFHTRWGGDENQMIDFPLTKVDVGVTKRGGRVQDKGQIRFRNLRIVE